MLDDRVGRIEMNIDRKVSNEPGNIKPLLGFILS
jgi:hypothetical protein